MARRTWAAGLACALGITSSIATFAGARSAAAADLPVVVPQRPDPLLDALTIPADAATKGAWGNVISWPLLAIHSAVLPDGSLITYGTPPNSQSQEGRILDLWNPWEGTQPLAHLTVNNGGDVNSFCSLAVLLPDGDFLISGGNTERGSAIYDYGSKTARPTPTPLHQDRWYGTMTMLPDGRPLVTGGVQAYLFTMKDGTIPDGAIGITPEIYDAATGSWTMLTGATSADAFGPQQNKWWYPKQWVAPNGRVFGISADQMYWIDTTGTGAVVLAGNFKTPATLDLTVASPPNVGTTATAVMYAPGKILQVGGNGYYNEYPTNSSKLATIVDINGANPVLTETAPMANARQWANATVLPDGQVFVNGGTTYANAAANKVLDAEMWNPSTGTWTTMAAAATSRLYHSSSVLLPSGAVFTAGGGAPGDDFNQDAQVYYPPYLFTKDAATGVVSRAKRPVISRLAAQQFGYGTPIDVQLSDTTTIASASLIGLSTTTHSSNMGQRRIPVTFTQTGDRVTVNGPTSANLVPPGFYQLTVVDAAGVPSEGVIIGIGTKVATGAAGSLDQPTPTTTFPATTSPTTTVAPTTTTNAATTTVVGATTSTSPSTTTTTIVQRETIPPSAPGGSGFVATSTATDRFTAITPRRVLDTRPDSRIAYSGDKPTAGQTITVHLDGLPADATSASLNITGTDPNADGYVTVWPCDSTQPDTSNLNLTRGRTTPNAVLTKVSATDTICIYTDRGTHLIADLTGWFSGTTAFTGVAPRRVLDTRPDSRIAYSGDKPTAGQTITVHLDGLPADATSASLNITGTDPTDTGYVTVWPCDSTQPDTSNLNLTIGLTTPNAVVTKISSTDTVCLFTERGTHLIADLTGWFPGQNSFTGIAPRRVLDTRPDSRIAYSGDKPTAGQTITVHLDGLPATATAASLNITGTDPTDTGYVTVWPCDSTQPDTSNLNLTTGLTTPNAVLTKVSATDTICIYTDRGTHLIADLTGWF